MPIRLTWYRPFDGLATPPFRFDPTLFKPALRTRLLILQSTPFCNIDCDYCYLPNRSVTARMEMATIRRAAQRLAEDGLLGPSLTVVWHAGEPLTLPPSYYDEAVATIDEVLGGSCTISHSVQTNGTLINDAWCDLFARHRFRVGISVDGPADLHDAHRRTRTGRDTHARVVSGMQCLRSHGIDFHAIAVVTPATFARADAFVDFFAEHGIRDVGCNFDEAEGVHMVSSVADHEREHEAFVDHLIRRSMLTRSVRFRELTQAHRLIAEGGPRYQWNGRDWPENTQVIPFAFVSVSHTGDFSTFSPELLGQPSAAFHDFSFGNVAKTGYLASAQSELFSRVWSAIVRGVMACEESCAHFNFCGGGAPANKLYENGRLDTTETLYCRTMIKRPFNAVLAALETTHRAQSERTRAEVSS